jgi:hypothetical protein
MADETGSLTFCLDHNFSLHMLQVLRSIRMEPQGRITHFSEIGISRDAADEDWILDLRQKGNYAVITRDGDILQAAIRRRAWLQSGVMLFLLGKQWGQLPLGELARRLIFWWPALVQHAEAAQPGSAWTVMPGIPKAPSSGIRLIRPPQD